jgi:hypothetical protein
MKWTLFTCLKIPPLFIITTLLKFLKHKSSYRDMEGLEVDLRHFCKVSVTEQTHTILLIYCLLINFSAVY